MAREVSVAGRAADGGSRSLTASDERPPTDSRPPRVEDTGLRQILTWTFVALIVSLVMAYIGVGLAIRYFDRP